MTQLEVITALTPVFGVLGAKLTNEDWQQYHLALQDVNPGDLDDALEDVRKTHAFRNAPLPAEILKRAESARKARIAASSTVYDLTEQAPIQTGDGELRTFTLPGTNKTLTIRVLPDDHPALRRYACLACKDTSWVESPQKTSMGNSQMIRCGCWKNNPVIAMERQRRLAKTEGRR